MMFLKKQYLLRLGSLRFISGAVILSLFLASYWQWLAYQQFLQSPLNFSEQQTITIKSGTSINSLARQWQKEKVISSQYYLRFYALLNPQLKNIKMGEYKLAIQETPVSLLSKFNSGKVLQYPFRIIEGMNSFSLIQLINETPHLINDLQSNPINLAQQLEIPINKGQAHIEGWLYPDTYYFSKNEKASNLLKRTIRKMQLVLEQEWQKRDLSAELPYKTPYDALIMASIIEKETGISSERSKIAGVFVRRLKKNMQLGTDPTVIYGIGPSFNGDITFKDLRTKTPYNTRIIKGLTPTPIAMPARESIYAALHPDQGNTLYFVADGSGGHYFSETLEEHNQAVKRYLKLIRKR